MRRWLAVLWLLSAATCEEERRVVMLVVEGLGDAFVTHLTDTGNRTLVPPQLRHDLISLISRGATVHGGLSNSFSSERWPSLRTLVTGQWEETHGIIGDSFYQRRDLTAPSSRRRVSPATRPALAESSTPVWQLLERNGVTSACFNLPYCDVISQTPTFHHSSPGGLINATLAALSHAVTPARFVIMGYPDLLQAATIHGSESEETMAVVDALLELVAHLMRALQDQDIDVIITSSHGLVDVDRSHSIHPRELVPALDHHHHVVSPAYVAIWNYSHTGDRTHSNVKLYAKDAIPDSWHWKRTDNAPDFLMVAEPPGWFFSQPGDQTVNYTGVTGYPPETAPELRPFLWATGPSFAEGKVVRSEVELVDVVTLVTYLLEVDASRLGATNGSLARVTPLLNARLPPEENDSTGVLVSLAGFALVAAFVTAVLAYMSSQLLSHVRRSPDTCCGAALNFCTGCAPAPACCYCFHPRRLDRARTIYAEHVPYVDMQL